MADCCDACQGNSGFHRRARQQLTQQAHREVARAENELYHLQGVLNEVIWYNFERNSGTWGSPWQEHHPQAILSMQGFRLVPQKMRGRTIYTQHYPTWWAGPWVNAPELPNAIIMNEVSVAKAYVDELKSRVDDAEDYAPGGKKYEELCASTLVGR